MNHVPLADEVVRPVLSYSGQTSGVSSGAWSPNGTRFASGSWDKPVQVWNTQTGACVCASILHASVLQVAWSPDGTRLASVDADDRCSLWYVGNASVSSGPQFVGVCAVAWSPDGAFLALGTPKGGVHIKTAQTGVDVWAYKLPYVGTLQCRVPNQVNTLAWSPDGMRIAAGGLGGAIEIRDASTGELCLATTICGRAEREVQAVSWSSCGKYIALASLDRWVRVLHAETGERVATWCADPHCHVRTVDWSRDGRRVAAGDDEGRVVVWNAATGQPEFAYTAHTKAVWSLAWSPDGHALVSGSSDGTVLVVELPCTNQRFHIPVPQNQVLAHPSENRVCCSCNAIVRDWSPR